MAAYRDRMKDAGMTQKTYWVTPEEGGQLKQVVDCWHGEPNDLSLEQQAAAEVLKPKKGA